MSSWDSRCATGRAQICCCAANTRPAIHSTTSNRRQRNVEYLPWWQSAIVPALYTTVGKTITDISMCADENVCPAEITVNGVN